MNSKTDLRKNTDFDSIYFQAKSLRNDTRRLERESLQDESNNSTIILKNWHALYDQAHEIIQKHSIDIEACSWLIEASLRLNSLKGLLESWKLTTELLKANWPSVFPTVNDSDTPHPFESLSSLNGEERAGTLILALQNLPITDPETQPCFALWQYHNMKNNTELKIKVEQAINLTQAEFYQSQLKLIEAAKLAFEELMKLLHELDTENAPPSQNIIKALQEYQLVIHDISQRYAKIANSADVPESALAETTHQTNVNSREAALNHILEIAHYFEKNEPHSPLATLLRRCARWGELPFDKLLTEMIKDQSAKNNVFDLIGVEKNS